MQRHLHALHNLDQESRSFRQHCTVKHRLPDFPVPTRQSQLIFLIHVLRFLGPSDWENIAECSQDKVRRDTHEVLRGKQRVVLSTVQRG